jgi:hypothetical protein
METNKDPHAKTKENHNRKNYIVDRLFFLFYVFLSSLLFTIAFGHFYSDKLPLKPAWYFSVLISASAAILISLIPIKPPSKRTKATGMLIDIDNYLLSNRFFGIRGVCIFVFFNLGTIAFAILCEGEAMYTLYGVSFLYASLLIWYDYVILKSVSTNFFEKEQFEQYSYQSRMERLKLEYEFRFWMIKISTTFFIGVCVLFPWQSAKYSIEEYGQINNHSIWGIIVATVGAIGMLLFLVQILAKTNHKVMDKILSLRANEKGNNPKRVKLPPNKSSS